MQATHTDSIILSGDVGGTKTNLSLARQHNNKPVLIKEEQFATADFASITDMLKQFLQGEVMPAKMCLGVAGPVNNGKVKFTNVNWEIDERKISAHFDNVPVCLINDLESTAYGIEVLEDDDFEQITGFTEKQTGNIGVIAPGTGLGEAGIYNGTLPHPFATEGGHCDFAPRQDIDIELLQYLQNIYGHVSWERVISGRGIYTIFEFLRDVRKMEVPAHLAKKLDEVNPKAISEHADECEICGMAMQMFFRYLATEAGNLALKLKATGGMYIGGGIVYKNIGLLNKPEFINHFCNVGRLSPLLQNISITVIMNNRAALLGAAHYAFTRIN